MSFFNIFMSFYAFFFYIFLDHQVPGPSYYTFYTIPITVLVISILVFGLLDY